MSNDVFTATIGLLLFLGGFGLGIIIAVEAEEPECETYTLNEYVEGNIPARCSGWLEEQE